MNAILKLLKEFQYEHYVSLSLKLLPFESFICPHLWIKFWHNKYLVSVYVHLKLATTVISLSCNFGYVK